MIYVSSTQYYVSSYVLISKYGEKQIVFSLNSILPLFYPGFSS